MNAYKWFREYLDLSGSAHHGTVWQCPAHPDSSPSLSVSEGEGGMVLLHCHAGCSAKAVVDALGLGLRSLYVAHPWRPPVVLSSQLRLPTYERAEYSGGGGRRRGAPISTVHHVYLPNQVRMERTRYADGGKTCVWERKVGSNWVYGLGIRSTKSLPLYQRVQLKMGLGAGWPIVLCESESSVDALLDAGIYATTWAGGADTPPLDRLRRELVEATVVWIPDHDVAGIRCSERVTSALEPVCNLRIMLPPPGQDARDLLLMHGGEYFRDIVDGRALSP